MVQFNINVNFDELVEEIQKSDLSTAISALVVTLLNQAMEEERTDFLNADSYQRTDNRHDYRNGYYERDLVTKVGTIRLKVPRTRSGEFQPSVFERYKRMDIALIASLIEMYVNGLSTRKVTKIVEELCGESISKSAVSRYVEKLDKELAIFKKRSLTHSSFQYIYLDAMYIKVREDAHVVSKAVYIAIGVNDQNKREVLGYTVAGEESEANWSTFLTDLKSRGLVQPKMVISDAHIGLKNAIQKVFVGSIWQRCTVHFIRNIVDAMPKKDSKPYREKASQLLRVSTQMKARELKAELEEQLQDKPKYTKALDCLDNGFEDAIQYILEPEWYHVSLRTTNTIERINRELRRRDKVICIHPNVEAAERIVGAILRDIHQDWTESSYEFLPNK